MWTGNEDSSSIGFYQEFKCIVDRGTELIDVFGSSHVNAPSLIYHENAVAERSPIGLSPACTTDSHSRTLSRPPDAASSGSNTTASGANTFCPGRTGGSTRSPPRVERISWVQA